MEKNSIFDKLFFLIKYLIPFRKLLLIIGCKEETFIDIIKQEIFNFENNKTINKNKYDFSFIGSINESEKTINISRNSLLATWRSDALFTGRYSIPSNGENISLVIKMRYSSKTIMIYLIILTIILSFLTFLPLKEMIFLIVLLYAIFINYYFQEDAIILKRDFLRVFREKNISVNVIEKIW